MDERKKKLVPLVKSLSRKRGDVNHVYLAEDVEQEVWVNIERFWSKLENLDEVSLIKYVKTMFKRRRIDIIKNQSTRKDTCIYSKFSYLTTDVSEDWATREGLRRQDESLNSNVVVKDTIDGVNKYLRYKPLWVRNLFSELIDPDKTIECQYGSRNIKTICEREGYNLEDAKFEQKDLKTYLERRKLSEVI